jgi:hypothetical protein
VELTATVELVTLLQSRVRSLEGEAAAARARCEHLEAELDRQRNRAAFYRVQGEGLAEDNRRLRSELGARAEAL